MPERYVVVNATDRVIVGGPYLWDGQSDWSPPEQGELMTQAEALAKGYSYPAVEYPPGEGE